MAVAHCSGCGRPSSECEGCGPELDPPRFCAECGRRLTVQVTPAGTLYNKNGLWQNGSGQTEQSLAYFLPQDMELVVLANSRVGSPPVFFRDLVTNLYVDHLHSIFEFATITLESSAAHHAAAATKS